MTQMDIAHIFQLISWITALIELIMGLYILTLNIKNNANRHVSVLLIIFAINTFAQGQLFTASRIFQIEVPILLLAATTPAIQPGLLLIAILLLKPQWLRGWMVLLKWFLYGLIALPIVLTLLDTFSQTDLWFTGLQLENYTGGFVNLQLFTQGILGPSLRITFIYAITVVTIFPLAYIAIFDKSITQLTRRLAFILLGTQVLAVSLNFVLFFLRQTFYGVLITSTIFAIGYTYATFWQLISERRLQSGKLQLRLTASILAITIPVLVSLSAYIITRAGELIQLNASQPVEETRISFIGFQTVVWIFIGVGIFLLGALTTLTIRQRWQLLKGISPVSHQ
jgi:hypothetical protein